MKFSFLAPHLRLIYGLLLSLCISFIQHQDYLLIGNVIALIFLITLLKFNQKKLKPYFFRWLAINLFTLFIWLSMSWKIGTDGITSNPQGIQLAWLITLRMNLILLVIWTFLINISDVVLVQAISKLPLPEKLIHLFILTVRYISLLAELNHKMDMAMRARGYQAKFNGRTVQIYTQRIVLLLIHAMLKAEKSEMALKARGFQFEKTK